MESAISVRLWTETHSMLDWLYGDEQMRAIFSIRHSIELWIEVEVGLAKAQGSLGIIPERTAVEIEKLSRRFEVDVEALRRDTLTVGYPILPLIRQMDEALPENSRGCLHFGATTQDIMDTALSMQLGAANELIRKRVNTLGDGLAALVEDHQHTVMAGRTHGQHAVPTTFGAKCAGFLAEITRHSRRLDECARRSNSVSLFGAAGTGASLGDRLQEVRQLLAAQLGLATVEVPWHVARDSVAEFLTVSALISGTCARFAREVIDLSRTEVGEVHEALGHHRGASSTMPQKRNPVMSEACLGMAISATTMVPAGLRAMEAGHERAAGEWQIEWKAVPEAITCASSAVLLAGEIASTLSVDPDRMRKNLKLDHGLIMSEHYMIALAPQVGRENAHDAVYEAVALVRSGGVTLRDALCQIIPEHTALIRNLSTDAATYLGQAQLICESALQAWAIEERNSQRDRDI